MGSRSAYRMARGQYVHFVLMGAILGLTLCHKRALSAASDARDYPFHLNTDSDICKYCVSQSCHAPYSSLLADKVSQLTPGFHSLVQLLQNSAS